MTNNQPRVPSSPRTAISVTRLTKRARPRPRSLSSSMGSLGPSTSFLYWRLDTPEARWSPRIGRRHRAACSLASPSRSMTAPPPRWSSARPRRRSRCRTPRRAPLRSPAPFARPRPRCRRGAMEGRRPTASRPHLRAPPSRGMRRPPSHRAPEWSLSETQSTGRHRRSQSPRALRPDRRRRRGCRAAPGAGRRGRRRRGRRGRFGRAADAGRGG